MVPCLNVAEERGQPPVAIRKRHWKSAGGARSAWVVDHVDEQGRRRLKTFRGEAEAESWWAARAASIRRDGDGATAGGITLAKAGEDWLARAERAGRQRSTLAQYRQHLRDHILPLLGSIPLARLTGEDLARARAALLQKLSRPTAAKVLTSLKSLLKQAERQGNLTRNLTREVTIPAPGRARSPLSAGVSLPSVAEIQAILAALEARWRPLVVTAIFTGLRASELRGLTWDDLELDRGLIRVRRRADRWNQLAPPRSPAARRALPLTPTVVQTLKAWRQVCPSGPLRLVFPNGAGKVEGLANIYARGLAPAQVAAGVVGRGGKAKYGLQALRDFYAAWLIEQGFAAQRVQALLGHSMIQMTMDRYGHLFPDQAPDDQARLAADARRIAG